MSNIGRFRLAAVMAGLGVLNAFGATYYASPTPVDPSTDGYCEKESAPGTIADAVGKTSTAATSWDSGDTVILLDGTYDYSAATPVADATDGASYIVVKGHPYLTIKSKSGKPENAVIAGGRVADETICTDARGLLLGGSLRIQGIGISNFWTRASGGGAFIMASASVTFSNCVFSCNKSRNGGGLYVKNTEQKIYKCTFRGNSTFTDGHDNYQANFGGGIKSMKKIDVYDCMFESNFGYACGCISVGSGSGVYNSTFIANTNGTQTINGAMLYNCGVVSNCVFRRNRVEDGSGLKASTVRKCKFICNSTGGSGGIGGGSSSYYDCVFYSNRFERLNISYAYGSCLNGATRAVRCLFLSCGGTAGEEKSGTSYGGAVANTPCTDCVFSNCVATGRGGVICGGMASNCLFVANTATGCGLAADSAVLRNCVITNNGPLGVGWGATFVNCLIADNGWNRSVDQNGLIGGGVAYNCTIVNNKSSCTMYNGKLYNCILWNPNSPEYCGSNGVVSNCIFRSGSCWLSSQMPKIMGDNIEIGADEVKKIRFRGTGDHPFDIGRNSIAHGGACDHNRYFDETSVDLAGRSRLSADGELDIGCYQYTAKVGLMLLVK